MKFREEISGCILIEIKSPLVIFVCHGIHHQCHFHASQLDISIQKILFRKLYYFLASTTAIIIVIIFQSITR